MFTSVSKKNKITIIYMSAYVLISALFLKLIYAHIIKSFFEQDLLWFIPTILRETKDLRFMQLTDYLLRPYPLWFEVPSLKAYVFIVAKLFGASARHFIFLSILIHFCSSALLISLGRKLGLSLRVSFLAGVIYLAFFAHFHAYMWPMAFQHLIVVFFVLLGVNLYLKTDSLMNDRGKYIPYYILTLLTALISSFCRLTIIILPLMILTHILFCSKDYKESLKKYNLWLPLFVIYLFFPVLTVIAGDGRLDAVLRSASSSLNMKSLPILQINPIAEFIILFLSGLACLFILRFAMVMLMDKSLRKSLSKFALVSLIIAAALLFITGGPKRFLIPYNIFAPFAGLFRSFLDPIAGSLSIDPAAPYHFIGLELSVFILILSAIFLWVFVKEFVSKSPGLILLFIFYPVILVYIYLRNPMASRYFIYLSPLFSVIFASVASYIYDLMIKGFKLKEHDREIIAVLLVILLCAPNLIAIKLALFRGKLANNYLVYDYIKTAGLIKEDLGHARAGKIKEIYVSNIHPLRFIQTKEFSAHDSENYNFKFILKQALDNPSVNIYLNQSGPKADPECEYSLDNYAVVSGLGKRADNFHMFADKGIQGIKANNYSEASAFFEKALEIRPFVLNYLLGKAETKDLKWIRSSGDLNGLLDAISSFYSVETCEEEAEKSAIVRVIIRNEIDTYIKCLFYSSFLEFKNGDVRKAMEIFADIRFLDNDFNSVMSLVSGDPVVMASKDISSYVKQIDEAWLFVKTENYRDRYEFERFLARMAFKL